MNYKTNGDAIEIFLEGPISEKTELFDVKIQNFKNIKLNLSKVTFINSIGVKNWISWTVRFSLGTKLVMEECPYVIVNQVNIVHGFVPKGTVIASFIAPFLCESCAFEMTMKLENDVHYKYAVNQLPHEVHLPDLTCTKCASPMEPDFMVEKIFSFLKEKAV
ncbi:hypothetical protein [Bdellovibrio sp. GT3]|uniref:hypothetical protein n=1 Tax=Bdellovibrio sp. GT3 TaxID=3136282 RepID=UPI0030F2FA35